MARYPRYIAEKVNREVAPHTCPILDDIIRLLGELYSKIPEDLEEGDGISNMYQNALDKIEEVRKHNHALREALVEDRETLEDTKDELEKKTSECEEKDSRIDELETEKNELEEKIEELKEEINQHA
jgi:predicted nuclease with TOPRIM domain